MIAKLVSLFGDKEGMGSTIFLCVHFLGRSEAFVAMTAFTFSVAVVGVAKLAF